MKNKYYNLFLILSLFFCTPVLGTVSLKELSQHTRDNLSEVPEFDFILQTAKKMGIRVYLFGGSAAAFAHYIRWDLERLSGDTKHQPERFDYDFTNIYRGNQDLDLVVDGTEEQALELQEILQSTYPHFVGDKQSWEVRLLRSPIGDKLPLLNDPDFKNQHTDTNSTGMLELTAQGKDPIYRDLLDWENEKSQFLKDVAAARITYLFNPKHEETSRFIDGKNPPIFSAIRYLAKLTQYEVQGTQKDLKKIKEIIDETDFSSLSGYVRHKLSEFALKTLLNSPNSEYAWDLMDQLNLRRKLIKMDGNRTYQSESLSWWLNKEPLRTKRFGTEGTTAKELFGENEIIVSHETNSFQAYENITRSSYGEANAFISRDLVEGEAAVLGDGFYVKKGFSGARYTGLTIRFKLHPHAREGEDFIFHRESEYIVVKNKKALKLIQENINVGIIEFIKLVQSNQISANDKGLSEKIRRKLGRVNRDSQEFKEAIEALKRDYPLLQEDIMSPLVENFEFNNIFDIYLNGVSNFYPDYIGPALIKNPEKWSSHPDFIKRLVKSGNLIEIIISDLLPRKEWTQYPEIVSMILKHRVFYHHIIKNLFIHEHWIKQKKLLTEVLNHEMTQECDRAIISTIFKHKYWIDHPEEIFKYLSNKNSHYSLFNSVFSNPEWVQHVHLFEEYFDSSTYSHKGQFIIEAAIKPNIEWAQHPDFLLKILRSPSLNPQARTIALRFVFSNSEWFQHKELVDFFLEHDKTDLKEVLNVILLTEFNEFQFYIVNKLMDIEDSSNTQVFFVTLIEKVLIKKGWEEHPELIEKLIKKENSKINESITHSLLSYPHWRKHYIEYLTLMAENTSQQILVLKTLDIYSHVFTDIPYELIKTLSYRPLNHPYLARNSFFNFDHKVDALELMEILLKSMNGATAINLAEQVFPHKKWLAYPEFIDRLIKTNRPEIHHALLEKVFSQSHWQEQAPELFAQLLSKTLSEETIKMTVMNLLSQSQLIKQPEILEKFISFDLSEQEKQKVIDTFFSHTEWSEYPHIIEKFLSLPLSKTTRESLFKNIFKKSEWSQHPHLMVLFLEHFSDGEFLVKEISSSSYFWLKHHTVVEALTNNFPSITLRKILTHPHWIYNFKVFQKIYLNHPNKESLFVTLDEQGFFKNKPEAVVFAIEQIEKPQEGLLSFIMSAITPDYLGVYIIRNILTKVTQKPAPEILVALMKKGILNRKISSELLHLSYWKEHSEFKAFLNGAPFTSQNIIEQDKKTNFNIWIKNYRISQSPRSCRLFL